MERAKGIEPSYEAWEASVLPLNYARTVVAGKQTKPNVLSYLRLCSARNIALFGFGCNKHVSGTKARQWDLRRRKSH